MSHAEDSGSNNARYQPVSRLDESHFPDTFSPDLSASAQSSSWPDFSSVSQLYDWLKRRPILACVAAACACTVLYLIVHSLTASAAGRAPLDVNLFLSDDDTKWKSVRKIDESGAYRRYDDITTVMKARTRADPVYRIAHTKLYSYADLVSPLPVSSYHVTLVEVIGLKHSRSREAYNANITANMYRLEQLQYQFLLEREPITFRVNHTTQGEADGHFKSAITLRLDPDTAQDASRLQRLLTMAKGILGDGLWAEPIGSHLYAATQSLACDASHRPPQPYTRPTDPLTSLFVHLCDRTLGYKVPKDNVEPSRYQPIVEEMDRLYRDVKIVCDPPILSAIHDMLDFQPV